MYLCSEFQLYLVNYLEYEQIYNQCFFDMRKELNIEPYNFYSGIEQLNDKKQNIYVLRNDNMLLGSVACYGNEIDDLIVNKAYQNNGLGRKILLWAIKNIRNNSDEPIVLHVAKWNEKALFQIFGRSSIETLSSKISFSIS